MTWWSFTSTTLEMSLLEDEQFCGKDGERTVFMISTTLGFDISAFSFYEVPHDPSHTRTPSTVTLPSPVAGGG